METNLKIVKFGTGLSVIVKRYDIVGQPLTKAQVQRFCASLARLHRIAAVPYGKDGVFSSILTECHDKLEKRSFIVDDWIAQLEPDNQAFKLVVSNIEERQLIADLYKRSFLIQVAVKTNMWTLDSPRIFFERDPFLKSDFVKRFKNVSDIEGYRKFEISEQYIENVGLGFSVNVATAFFTSLTVDDYFTMGYENRFKRLAGRQKEQKGTLLYEGPNGRTKCYFEQYNRDMTLATTPELMLGSKRFANLYAYYQSVDPLYPVKPTDKVAVVSFPGMEKKSFVPANKLYLRVMNDMLDYEMSEKDKIDPQERAHLLNKFWNQFGKKPFGQNLTEISTEFYHPDPENSGCFKMPSLLFGQNTRLNTPLAQSSSAYRQHFNERRNLLEKFGCYFVPETIAREIHFVFPEGTTEGLTELFSNEVCKQVSKLTKKSVSPVVNTYSCYEDMTTDLNLIEETGMVVFVFDETDSATYFHIRRELKDWQLKRITTHELGRTYKNLKDFKDGHSRNQKAERNWQSFIELNVYDIIQQMGCLPYVVEPDLKYDMQLVIDVSEKSSHLALSLFMYKKGMKFPISSSLIKPKTDGNKEMINKVLLERYLKDLLIQNKENIKKYQINSLLILRDGKDCGDEYEAITSVINGLVEKALFNADFKFDFVEYHKSSLKDVRIWEKNGAMNVNPLEGSYLVLDPSTGVLATTGSGTLHQGTAQPILVKTKYTECDLRNVLSDIFVSSQLNFSSPKTAQRLTFSAKRADEQLKDRVAQEVFRIK